MLADNPITSLAPLRGNGNIQYLNISCLPLDGLGDVSTLSGLRELNLSDMQVNSVEILTSLPLRRIQLYGVSLRNVWELSRMTELETVELQNLDQEGVVALAMLQHLTRGSDHGANGGTRPSPAPSLPGHGERPVS